MLIYLLQVTICLAIFYGFYHLALRKETLFHTNRMYLVITLLLSLVLPLVKIYIDARQADANAVLASYVFVGEYVNTFSAAVGPPSNSTIPWGKLFAGLYISGMAVMVFRFLLAIKQIRVIRKHGIRTMVSGHACVLSADVKSPFSFFNTIYLPQDHSFGETELNEVISHEMAHVRGWHTWDVLMMEFLCILLWPSPMIYLYRKSLKEVHEFVADAAVLKDTPWENYARLLLSQQHHQLQNVLSNQLIYSQLKKRLLMMNKERSGFAARYKYLGIIPVLLVALVLFSFREKQSIDISTTGTNSISSFQENFGIFQSLVGIKSTIQSDTLPEVMMISLRNNQPVAASASDPEMQDGVPPIFPGCKEVPATEQEKCGTSKLWEYIGSNLVYPEMMRSAGIQGIVIVKFTVGADGLVKNVSISKSLQPDADEVVTRIVKDMNAKVGKWQPALKDGKPVDAELSLPVKFALENSAGEEKPMLYAEELPRFPGCEHIANAQERSACSTQKMYEFIYSNIKYPKEDRDNNIEGQCIVQFTIGADGSISEINVVRSPSEGLKAEVERIMRDMAAMPDKWTPAKDKGIYVAMQFTLPVKFKLQDDDSPKPVLPAPAIESSKEMTLEVSPNPAKETITVSVFEGAHTIKVFDTSGNQVLTQKLPASRVESEQINVWGLKPGQYVVQVIGETKSMSGAFTIIK